MALTNTRITRLAKKYNVNLNVVSISALRDAITVEMEHTDDPDIAIRIALAHMLEYADYYVRLKRMEKQAERYWSNKQQPKILNE